MADLNKTNDIDKQRTDPGRHNSSYDGEVREAVVNEPTPGVNPTFTGAREFHGSELAIIGMSGRFPGARNIEEFWQNLCDGVESISFFTDEEIKAAGVDPQQVHDPHYVKAGGILDAIDAFDAPFFGIYPKEAAVMDPQHRLFLEVAWETLENAGYNPDTYPGWIGVFAGSGMNSYLIFNLIPNRETMESVHGYQLTIGNDKDFMPTRTSYKLNLRGPSVNVQTACSTSLVAVHMACQSLLSYQCDMALAGGVTIRLPQKAGYLYQEGGIASPDGHCRAFDAKANGTVGGNGAGVVLIKRLEDAIRDGDSIRAIIKGSAINNDGSAKVGYTAPSIDGQAEVISMAYVLANVDPSTVTYIEAHGTGTALGDPIEIAALTQAFREHTQRNGFCAIGSVKTNVGHLDSAAGVTSLIKTVLALENRLIPPSLHYENPNPRIDFANSPFFVNDRLREWELETTEFDGDDETAPIIRRAGVSSFGIGGTNVHLVLEEAGDIADSGREMVLSNQSIPVRDWELLLLSSRSATSLEKVSDNLVSHLKNNPELDLTDVAYTLQVGRKAFGQRRMVVCQDLWEGIDALEARDPQRVFTSPPGEDISRLHRSVIFMFSGQGAQYVNMTLDLYRTETIFRDQVDLCSEHLLANTGIDIRDVIFGSSGTSSESEGDDEASRLMQTEFTQPALFVIEYALAQLLISWGIVPQAMIGHSIGEYVAACLAGVFTLGEAISIVAQRGRLMQSLPGGVMLSLALKSDDAQKYLSNRGLISTDLALAAVNGPSNCVISGSNEAITSLEKRLAQDGVEFRRLKTSHAFHSSMVDPILEEFHHHIAQYDLQMPTIPFVSNVTGTWISDEQATDPAYWKKHLRQTVLFYGEALREIISDPGWVLLEIGPGTTLTTLVKSSLIAQKTTLGKDRTPQELVILPTLRHPRQSQSDELFLLTTLGRLWLAGVNVDWLTYRSGTLPRRVQLPTYPFERQSYWIEPDFPMNLLHSWEGIQGRNQQEKASLAEQRNIRKNEDISSWFYTPSWRRSELVSIDTQKVNDERWLVIGEGNFINNFIGNPNWQITTNVTQVEIISLLTELSTKGHAPNKVVFQGDLSGLLSLVQALEKASVTGPIRLYVITIGAQDVSGSETLLFEQAAVLGFSKVISQEYPQISCVNIDISLNDVADFSLPENAIFIERILMELAGQSNDRVVAYRGRHRWVQEFEQVPVSQYAVHGIDETRSRSIRQRGVYLIMGGLGRIGLVLASTLARSYAARLVLVDRLEFPPRSGWDNWLSSHTSDDPISARIQNLREIEGTGGEVITYKADVSDIEQVKIVLNSAKQHFGELNGVIYAAGLVGQAAIKAISEMRAEDLKKQSTPKITGIQVLDTALNETGLSDLLDFVFIQSSLSAILGGLGLSAYAAANSAIDLYSTLHNRISGTPWICVDWDGWKFSEEEHIAASIVDLSLTADEGIAAFELALTLGTAGANRNQLHGIRHLVISTADLAARLDRWKMSWPGRNVGADGEVNDLQEIHKHGATGDPGEDTSLETQVIGFPRPHLQVQYVAPRNDLERTATNLWQKVLGITPIGVYDDFFELGGHSLLATQLVTRLRDAFKVELPLRRLFETPTIAGLVTLIEEYQTSQAVVGNSLSDVSIKPVSRDGYLELSFGQQRLWFIDQLDPGSPLYNNFAALDLKGLLDVEGLRSCLNHIIERHESLRTSFQELEGQPVQIIHSQMDLPIELVDLRYLSDEDRQTTIVKMGLEEASRPFNLAKSPLLRVTIVELGEVEHVVFVTMHHIVSDGWSVGVLIGELATLYTAYQQKKNNPEVNLTGSLPQLVIQYADYAAWQRNWMQGEVLKYQLDYWRDKLEGQQPLELLPDYPRPAVQSWHGANIWFEIPMDLAGALVNLSQHEGVTLFMILMAAFQILLARYTGQDDISVGTPIANRTRAEVENLIGFVLNTLVMRSDFSGDPSFQEALKRVQETALAAYAHQDIPFEVLVEILHPGRDMSRAPFFQVIFDLQIAPLQRLELPELTISPIHIDSGTAKFDLALSMEWETLLNNNHRLTGYLNYNTDLFIASTIERLIEHFLILLGGIVTNPTQKLSELPLMTEAEIRQVLFNWNHRLDDKPPTTLVHDMIEIQAGIAPEKIAIQMAWSANTPKKGQRSSLTYAELEYKSNQLADMLRNLGIGRNMLVGMCVERSLDMIVGLIGILKAGGGFLPLDPTYPGERLAYMLEDSQAQVVLSHNYLMEEHPELSRMFNELGVKIIPLDIDLPDRALQTKKSDIQPDDLAYVIYTSGSTGKPKGVMISHKAIAWHCMEMINRFETNAGDRVLQFASFNFDAALEQIFTTLICGAQLVLRDNELWPVDEFQQKIDQYDLTVVNIPPAYWHSWVQYIAGFQYAEGVNVEERLSVSIHVPRLVIIGGDQMPMDAIELWYQSPLKQACLLNAYGPTETTITATTFVLGSQDTSLGRLGRVPIGQPHPNRAAFILDRFGNPTPIGAPGELYLGGIGLARGYLNHAELTDERFIEYRRIKPLSQALKLDSSWLADLLAIDNRLYKTGDLVRYLPDGNIDFLGRIDQQVKVRGFRIELGEIETVLGTHPAVQECAVILRSDSVRERAERTTEKILAAYIVSRQTISAGELFRYLTERLPAHMVPAVFITLEQMPISPGGKIDRKKLTQELLPEKIDDDRESTYVAPRTPIEVDITKVWVDVLGLNWDPSAQVGNSPIGIFDNFFELGGHSMLAMQIISRLREKYQVELPLRRLFETPNIAGIATVITQSLGEQESNEDIEALLDELEGLSDEEIRQILAEPNDGIE